MDLSPVQGGGVHGEDTLLWMQPVFRCCSYRRTYGCHSEKGQGPPVPDLWLMQVSHTWFPFPSLGAVQKTWAWDSQGCFPDSCVVLGKPGQHLPTSIHCMPPARLVDNTCPSAVLILCFPATQATSDSGVLIFFTKGCFLRYSVEGAGWWEHRISSPIVPFTQKTLLCHLLFWMPP